MTNQQLMTGKPKTTLQVRLSNGKRARVTLNLDHTVAQLDALIRADHGAEGGPWQTTARTSGSGR